MGRNIAGLFDIVMVVDYMNFVCEDMGRSRRVRCGTVVAVCDRGTTNFMALALDDEDIMYIFDEDYPVHHLF